MLHDSLVVEALTVLDPRVIESLLCCVSLVNILNNEALEEILSFLRMLLERFVIEMEVSFDYVSNDFEF